jgi:hypothetical protein
MQIGTKEPQAPKPQLAEAMSSQLSIFHLHMTSFSSWNNGGPVCKLADLREAASKIHSILVRSCSSEKRRVARKRLQTCNQHTLNSHSSPKLSEVGNQSGTPDLVHS